MSGNSSSAVSRMFELVGKSAVVTGGAAGIGAAISKLLSAAGASVAILDRDLDAAEAVAREVVEAGGEAIAVAADISSEESLERAFEDVRRRHARIDILVNNAGIYPRRSFMEISSDDWDNIQQINSRGTFFAMRLGAAAMIEQGCGGRIISISSLASQRNVVMDHVAYAASKAAVNALTTTAALELAPHGIMVNAVLPGGIRSETGQKSVNSTVNAPRGPLLQPGRIPLGRMGAVDDIAGPVLFLAGAASSYMTGQLLIVDGGFVIS